MKRLLSLAAVYLLWSTTAAATDGYDTHLCATAQRLLINADSRFPVTEQRGTSNGFHTIQMSIDTEQRGAVIAMSTHTTEYAGVAQPTYIACKMVDRERVNAVLQMQLPGPDRQCGDVNAAMQRWVTKAAFDATATLIPATNAVCTAAAKECAARHASRAALAAAKNRYEGAGGVFASAACADRADAPAIAGTCVFHCNAGDETLWHIGGAVDPRMTKGCDLYIGD